MPDYNLGRAHGTIRIDYEKSGAPDAQKDVKALGDEAKKTEKKIDDSVKNSTKAFDRIGDKAKNTNLTPKVNSSAFAQLVNNIKKIDTSTKKSIAGFNTFNARLRFLIAGVALAAPTVAGLGVALVGLAGTAGVAAGALASLAAIGGTVATGMSGIGDAFKAAGQQSKAAATGAASSAKAQRSAAQAIEGAKRALTDAEENLTRAREDGARAAIQAARAVLNAEHDVSEAQRDAIRAQRDLSRARQEAIRDLEDMRDALTGGALDERQAVLDLKDAQAQLAAVKADPTANANDIAKAVLNLEKQEFALQRLQKENQRLAVDEAAAAAAGVSGSDKVVSAQDSVRNSAYQVQQAQQGLADAQENVRITQVESARAISDAIQGVIDAQQNLSDAYLDAAESGGAAAAKLDDAMKNLSPNARAFVSEVLSLKGAWDSVRKSVQDELFAGLAAEVKPLANTYLPLLREGMGKVAKGLNLMAKDTIEYLKTTEAQANVSHIFDTTGVAVTELRGVLRDLLAAFLDIASVGVDFLPDMARGAADAAARFREFISAAKESGKLKVWMQEGIDTTKQLWELLKNLGSIISSVFTGLNQSGGGALVTLTDLTGKIAEFLKTAEGQEALRALGSILHAIATAGGKIFLSFLSVAADLLVKLEPLIVEIADGVGNILAGAWVAFGVALGPVADLLGTIAPVLGPIVAGVYAMNKAIGAAKTVWAALNVVMKANPFLVIAGAIIAIVLLIIQNWDTIGPYLEGVWNKIKDIAEAVWGFITDRIIEPIQKQWKWITDTWNAIVQFFVDKWNSIKDTAVAVWNGIDQFFKNVGASIRDGIRDFVTKAVDFFKDLPGKIMDFIKSLPGKLANWAGDLISGIVKGLGDAAYKVWQKLKQIVSEAWDSVLGFFGIRSPSRLAAWAGEMIVEGLAGGIEGMASTAVKAAAAMANAVGDELTGASSTLATNVALTGDASGLPNSLGMTVPLTAANPTAAAAANGGSGSGKMVVIHIDRLELAVAGNLDPTNPTAFRRTIVSIKDSLLNLDKEYA